MRFVIEREPTCKAAEGCENFTLGKMYLDGVLFCQTCEDEERHLDEGGNKVYGKTAIPKGRYALTLSFSHKFGKLLPEVLSVPGFSGVRIHGGNKAEDSLGCVLVGKVRTATGIAQCKDTVERIIGLLQTAEDRGEIVTLEIK